MIQLHNITKSFGTLQVLKGIDLHIGKGEVVSIVGGQDHPSADHGHPRHTRLWFRHHRWH